eukprot:669150-Prymnesium_polylepis.1
MTYRPPGRSSGNSRPKLACWLRCRCDASSITRHNVQPTRGLLAAVVVAAPLARVSQQRTHGPASPLHLDVAGL